MAILFSQVTVSINNDSEEFLMPGIPRDSDDLEEWSEAGDYLTDIDSESEVQVQVETFLYGDGETVAATEDDLVKIKDQIRHEPDFLDKHCDNIEDSEFSFVWCPEELFDMKM